MKQYKLNLTVVDRLNLPTVLPELGKYEVGVMIKDLRELLAVSTEEFQGIDFVSQPSVDGSPGSYRYNPAKDKPKSYLLNEVMFNLARKAMKEMEEKEKLPTQQAWLSLYDKIINAQPVEDKKKKTPPAAETK